MLIDRQPRAALNPFTGSNLWSLLQRRAERGGALPFVTWHPFEGEGRTWSYGEMLRDASAIAAGLADRGVTAGDHVLIHLENCPEFLVTWFACAAIGAVAVTTNTRSAPDEIRYYAEHCGAVGAVTQPRFAEAVAGAATGLGWLVSLDHDAGEPVDAGRRPDRASSFAALHGDPGSVRPVAPDPLAPMSVQYTSGTTSRPKGVLWTHANALWGARVNAAHEDLRPEDCHLVYMPMFHANAMAYSVLATLWVGGRIALLPKWSTSRFWDISLRHGCTWLSLIGPSLRTLLTTEAPPRHSYRMFGAGLCDYPLGGRLADVKMIGWWGMTETVSHGIVGDPHQPNRPLSMGRPAPEYGIAVVREDGTPVEPEETGHLLVRGTPGLSLFAEYLHDPQATRDSFDEWGWFRTGDLVTPHADGHLSFADRAKDMLKVGAENVAASEIERVVMGVEGVLEAAVVSRPDEHLDEVAVAFVVAAAPRPDLTAEVTERCRAMLADFKVPRDVYVVDELPRSTLRKVNKVELRKVADPSADRAAAVRRWIDETRADPSGDAVS